MTLAHDEGAGICRKSNSLTVSKPADAEWPEQALIVETWLSDNARRAQFIQPQIVAQTAQPATDILRAAPVLFADQHMQPTVKRLPAIVASDTSSAAQ